MCCYDALPRASSFLQWCGSFNCFISMQSCQKLATLKTALLMYFFRCADTGVSRLSVEVHCLVQHKQMYLTTHTVKK